MSFWSRWRRRRSAPVDVMPLVPVRLVDWQEDDEGRAVLLMPRFAGTIFHRFLQPRLTGPRRFIRIPLDRRGTHVWSLIDGRRPVGEIVAEFAAAFPEEEQATERVWMYLRELERGRLVRMDAR